MFFFHGLPGFPQGPDDQPGIGCLGLSLTIVLAFCLAAGFLALALYATSLLEW